MGDGIGDAYWGFEKYKEERFYKSSVNLFIRLLAKLNIIKNDEWLEISWEILDRRMQWYL